MTRTAVAVMLSLVAGVALPQSISGVGNMMNQSAAASSGGGGGLPEGTLLTESDEGIQTESDQYLTVE